MIASRARSTGIRILALGVAAALAGGVAPTLAAPAAEAQAPYDPETTALVNVVHFNDFHGRIEPASGSPAAGGTVGFAGTIEELRAEQGEENTLLLSGGDSIGASLYASSSQQDAPTLEVLNALDVNASAVGNHEFDRGIADLQDRVRDAAAFPYLAANVTYNGTPIDKGYEVFEVDGIRVGVIGAVTLETPTLVSPAGMAGVAFTNPVEAVNRIAAQLQDGSEANGEADVLIAEYHEGAQVTLAANAPDDVQAAALQAAMSESSAFRAIVEDTAASVDAIFNGHTHNTYTWMAPAPAGSASATRPIMQGGSYAAQLAQLVFTVDRTTKAVTVVDGYPRIVARTTTPAAELISTYPRVQAVDEIVREALAKAAVIGNEPLGQITADITTAYAGGKRDDRGNASALGTLVADMYRDATSLPERGGATIGVTNPGGLRAELLFAGDPANDANGAGVVTVGEAAAVLPFANNLWTTSLTGAQFTTLLEQQWQTSPDGSIPSRSYLALGLTDNVEYTYDSTAPLGSHITGVWIDGEPIDPAASYRVAAPIFLISGGDNFRIFQEGTNTLDSGLVDSDAFQSYIRDGPPLKPDFSRRQLDLVSLPTAPVAEGSTVTFTVNKIDLTSLGAPTSETLDLYLGDALIGQFAVASGSATVAFTVPAPAAPAALQSEAAAGAVATTFTLRTAAGTVVPFQLAIEPAAAPTPEPTPEPTPAPTSSAPSPSVPGATPAASSPARATERGALPRTGADALLPLAAAAALLALLGIGLVVRRRARR